jgi:hypothetical protein
LGECLRGLEPAGMQFGIATLPNVGAIMDAAKRRARDTGPGFASALFLHGFIVALIILMHMPIGSAPERSPLRIVPIDVVSFSEATTSPPAVVRSALPQQKRVPTARQEEANPVRSEGVAPNRTNPVPLDNLAAKLRALARLRQPESAPAVIDNSGQSDVTSTSDDAVAGDNAAYSVRDFVRQQVVRHWSLDLHLLGARRFRIAIHVVMTRTGRIEKAEIVDMQRYRVDPIFRDVALSARNAVLLSSPVPLPAGNYAEVMSMTLNFDPHDALQ